MKLIFTCTVLFSFFSCATSTISTQAIKPSPHPYQRIVTFYVEAPLELERFDSSFYVNSMHGEFNDLETIHIRSQLEKTLKRNLTYSTTDIITSSAIFKVNDKIDYSTFRERLDSVNADAILLINQDEYWITHQYSYSRRGHKVEEDRQPNSAFHCYLISPSNGEVLWAGRCTVRGVVAGYDTLNNVLARRLARKLKQDGYL